MYRDNPEVCYELIKKAQSGDNVARNELIEMNMGLVGSVVRKYLNRGQDYDDLFQIGSIGLIKAVDRFDMAFGVRFSTYAVPMIMGEIKRFLRDDGIIKVSRSIKETAFKIKQLREDAVMSNQDLSVNEISEILGISREDVIIAHESTYAPEYLQEPMYDEEDGCTLIDKVLVIGSEKEDDLIERIDLRQAIEMLTDTEREILVYRYYRGMTQTQVADILSISQVQVSRLEKRIITRIRQKIS